MALDLIKEYLIGIGFNVNQNSLDNAELSINRAGKTIQKFNESSNKGFSESNDSMKDFFSLLNVFSGNVGRLFPALQTPLKKFVADLITMKKLYNDITQFNAGTEKTNDKDNNKGKNKEKPTNNLENEVPKVGELLKNLGKDSAEGTGNALSGLKKLSTDGLSSLKTFASGSVGIIGGIVVAIAGLILAARGLAKFLDGLAKQDIEYEKLSRQLWTTKENAKEVDMALKTLGISMQDLWLSPTLLKQFNQLRKDSASLKLPKEYTDNLKVVHGIGLEFSRLKQLGQLAFQWIGNYILKYAAAPLNELKEQLHNINQWIIKNIPEISKTIGPIIAVAIRFVAILLQIIGVLWKITSPISALFRLIDQMPESAKKTGKKIIAVLMAIAAPLLLVIGLIDDINTYIKGGKSVIGGTIDKVSNKLNSLVSKIRGFGIAVKNVFKNIGDYLKKIIDEKIEYLEKKFPLIKKAIDFGKNIKSKWDNFWGNDEESKKKKEENITALVKSGLQFKNQFASIIGKNSSNNAPASYSTTNSSTTHSTTTSNSNNKVSNQNTFNIYGGNDTKSTANAVSDRFNNITTRNLQGAY